MTAVPRPVTTALPTSVSVIIHRGPAGLVDFFGYKVAPERRNGYDPAGSPPWRLVHSHARDVDCPEYETCLDVVCEAGWRQWTCENCPRFLAELAGAEPGVVELLHMARLGSDTRAFLRRAA